MELSFYRERKLLRQGSLSAEFSLSLPSVCGGSDGIEVCYRQAAEALEGWAQTEWLPQLERVFTESRHRRLHWTVPQLLYICEGTLIGNRFVSICVTLTREDPSGKTVTGDCRVWDGKRGCVCPIDLFLSQKDARRYHRWSYLLQEGQVIAYPRAKGSDNCIGKPELVRFMKNIISIY